MMCRRRKASIVVHLVAMLLMADPIGGADAFAVSRSCKYNITDIAVWINDASFTSRGYDINRIIQQVVNSISSWYVEGGANIRPYYAGLTTRTSPNDGEVLVSQGDTAGPPLCPLAVTVWFPVGGDCKKAQIALYESVGIGCAAQPIEWTLDHPESRYISISNVLTHEFGHALGGYSDDYSNPNTVMQANSTGKAVNSHLYNADICLLRHDNTTCTGANGPNAYGQRTNLFLKNKLSQDGITWSQLSTNIASSNLRPSAAAHPSQGIFVVGYVDSSLSNNPVKTRTGNGLGWNAAVTHPDSRVGVALVRSTNRYLLAYTEAADTRRIYTERSSDGTTWEAPVLVNDDARTQTPPGLAFNASTGNVLLFWSQHRQSTDTQTDLDRVKYSISTNEGTSWSTPQSLGGGTDREFFSFEGVAASCGGINSCLIVWPTWNTYTGKNLAICTHEASESLGALTLSDRVCNQLDDGRTPGIKWASLSQFTGWVLGRSGRDSGTSLVAHRKAMFDLSENWSAGTTFSDSSRGGVDVTSSSFFNEWEVYYVSP